jgi:hypothetical protein
MSGCLATSIMPYRARIDTFFIAQCMADHPSLFN